MKEHSNILFMGDVIPGGILMDENAAFPFSSGIGELFAKFDYRVCNLECPVSEPEEVWDKKNRVYAPPKGLRILQEMDVDLVSLANNHLHDLGYKGIENTIKALDDASIRHVGGGSDLEQARRPVVERFRDGKVGFLGYCAQGVPYNIRLVLAAGEDSPGVAPLDPDMVQEDIARLKGVSDRVFVLIHWGIENTWFFPPTSLDLAKKIVSWGADCIIGSHSHRVNGLVKMNGLRVYPSLGNFLFPNFVIDPPRTISYPEGGVDCSKLPKKSSYRDVTRRTYFVWNWSARIGMCVGISFEESGVSYREIITRQDRTTSTVSVAGPGLNRLSRAWLNALSYFYQRRWYAKVFPLLVAPHLVKLKLYDLLVGHVLK